MQVQPMQQLYTAAALWARNFIYINTALEC